MISIMRGVFVFAEITELRELFGEVHEKLGCFAFWNRSINLFNLPKDKWKKAKENKNS